MKRLFCLFLVIALCCSLLACHSGTQDSVTFYYSRNPDQYQYFEPDGVIHSESRDLTGHRDDLRYMVGLYLAGPLDEGMLSPFTKSTRMVSVEKEDGRITIVLSVHTAVMTDAEFSLACACLTFTCLNFTDCEEVTICSGSRSVTMDADHILLFDSLPTQETSEVFK